ncbi:unnamed protein product [Neospora caninum Liverpool]|uniref:Rhoptry kinase family protein ROP27, putative n=1 Tax=Neospora caninum (strain Liverpool) TaxID=572307 RepID=F0VNE2_NEOCL|nr:uncharacterized protein NCLIV_056620 [Neospora caninum Liverpool]CBZ55238.1 unnamed protein product [Neospora caninum Liverpool]CEL69967.1 TPA: Rhoptry kinase family protein ROP27, putative [Neospora caninum Liverpool]|eukprot:XP_003885266.1 uncharacterized protein NCLIV_056620 [Neospora caninum Liverpool]
MKSPTLGGGAPGCLSVWPIKPLGLVVLCFLLVLLVSEAFFLWRLQQLEADAARPSSLDSPVSDTFKSAPSPRNADGASSSSLLDAKDSLRLLLPSDLSKGEEGTDVASQLPQRTDTGGAASAEIQKPQVSSASSLFVSPTISSDPPRLRSLQNSRAPASSSAPEELLSSTASRSPPPSSLTEEEDAAYPHPTAALSSPPPPSPVARAPDSPSPEEGVFAVSASKDVQASAPSSPAEPPTARVREGTDGEGEGGKRTPAGEESARLGPGEGAANGAVSAEEEAVEDGASFRRPFGQDDAALLRLPDLLLAQNVTSFRMQFLSEDEGRRTRYQRQAAQAPPPRSGKRQRRAERRAGAPFFPPEGAAPHDAGSPPRWPSDAYPASPAAVHVADRSHPFASLYEPLLRQEPPFLPTLFPMRAPVGYGAFPSFSAGSSERRLRTEQPGDSGEALEVRSRPHQVSRQRSFEPAGSAPRGGAPGAAPGGAAEQEKRPEKKRETQTRAQRGGERVENSGAKAQVEQSAPPIRITRSVVGNALLRRQVRESGENLANLVTALAKSGPRTGAPQGEAEESEKPALEPQTPELLLADLPRVLFNKPSKGLVKAARALGRSLSSKEKQQLHGVIPFDVPFEVRSLATQKTRTLVFDGVLGAGGQGVVLLARDVDHPELEIAVKIFRIKKRNRGSSALHEIARLQRRLRWETAVLKHAPKDVSSYVWSQLAHLVMPLDIVEPVDRWEHADQDMRYWHQWLIFESFAGDIARLKKLYSGSGHVRLDASKQMFMACMRLHDVGMVHSDIKLANYFISKEGRIFLGDYSLSRPIGDVSPCVEGTLRFLPPENMRCIRDGERTLILSSKKDTWAVGVALYKLWCRNFFPFELDSLSSDQAVERVAELAREDLNFYPCAPDTPVAVMDLIAQMLDPNVETRPTLRELYVSHPVFSQLRKATLQYTVSDLRAEQGDQQLSV